MAKSPSSPLISDALESSCEVVWEGPREREGESVPQVQLNVPDDPQHQWKCLDLFSGAGGATRGLQLAGFHVTGIDINPQPHYIGDEFFQEDALTFPLENFDAIWASPPCQGYSGMSSCRPGLSKAYPRLIADVRERILSLSNVPPFVIENVLGAKDHLINPILLCGQMFGLELYRHRLFESNIPPQVPRHPQHIIPASKAGHWTPGTIMSVAGHIAPVAHARKIMEIDWMNREELSESIPPAYSKFIGTQIINHLNSKLPTNPPDPQTQLSFKTQDKSNPFPIPVPAQSLREREFEDVKDRQGS